MRHLRLVPDDTRINFMSRRYFAFAFTLLLTIATVVSLLTQGLNLGLDFEGGILVEARAQHDVDVSKLREQMANIGLGSAILQTFGDKREVVVRVHQQPGNDAAEQRIITKIKTGLGPTYEFRRASYVGPQVSHDLLVDGILASSLAVLLIAVYVWFRFEWQFGVSALITTLHDVVVTVGLFSVLHLDFNLTIVAAILTIAGYSINDTVVVFDRIRENLRKYKKMGLLRLVNLSVNQTLSRTVLTSGTTILSVVALLIFGGPVLRNFATALAWGILIGTYSSIFVASALLLHMPGMRPIHEAGETEAEAAGALPEGGRTA